MSTDVRAGIVGERAAVMDVEFDAQGEQKTGKERLVLSGHTERPTHAHFAPDGRALASFDASGLGLLFELEHGTAVGRFTGHAGIVSALAFTPDSRRVVTGSFDGTVRLWANPLGK